jgi:hypothetical protein
MAKKSKEVAINRQERLQRLQQYGKAAKGSSGSIIGKLLTFNKGEWTAGQDNEEIPVGTKMVFNSDSVLVGWTRWEDSKPVEQEMGPVVDGFQPKPRGQLGWDDKSEWEQFPDGGPRDPWAFGNQMLFKSVTKRPELFTFTTGSKGGLGAIGRLLERYAEEAMEGHADDYPVITLGADSYMHPTYKKVWVPEFEIVGWQPIEEWEIPEAAAPARKTAASKGRKQLSY